MKTLAIIALALSIIIINVHLALIDREVNKLKREYTVCKQVTVPYRTPHIACEKKEATQ